MLKKAMLGLMALCFAVVLGSPTKANAQVAFGATLMPAHTRVFVGGYAAPGYYNGYDYDDDDYVAPYPSYGYAYPAYNYPYAYNNGYYPYYGGHEYWEHRGHEYREHREHEWREHHHHDHDDWRR